MGFHDENIRRIEELEALIDDLIADRDEERMAKAWELFSAAATGAIDEPFDRDHAAEIAFACVDAFFEAERKEMTK